jgi:hypothetical protein
MNQKTEWLDLTAFTDIRKKYNIPLLDWPIEENPMPLPNSNDDVPIRDLTNEQEID